MLKLRATTALALLVALLVLFAPAHARMFKAELLAHPPIIAGARMLQQAEAPSDGAHAPHMVDCDDSTGGWSKIFARSKALSASVGARRSLELN